MRRWSQATSWMTARRNYTLTVTCSALNTPIASHLFAARRSLHTGDMSRQDGRFPCWFQYRHAIASGGQTAPVFTRGAPQLEGMNIANSCSSDSVRRSVVNREAQVMISKPRSSAKLSKTKCFCRPSDDNVRGNILSTSQRARHHARGQQLQENRNSAQKDDEVANVMTNIRKCAKQVTRDSTRGNKIISVCRSLPLVPELLSNTASTI